MIKEFCGMQCNKYACYLLYIIIAILPLQGCAPRSQSQINMIKDGYRPAIGIVTALPEEIFIEYIGITAFENGRHRHQTRMPVNDYFNLKIVELLEDSKLSTAKSIKISEINNLESLLKKPLIEHSYEFSNEQENKIISEWATPMPFDYILFVHPSETDNFAYQRLGMVTGQGILANLNTHHLFATYKFNLFDVKAKNYASKNSCAIFQQIPTLKRTLSTVEYNELKEDWESEKYDSDNYSFLREPFDKVLEFATHYKSDDFSNLSNKQIEDIENLLRPLTNRCIQKNLNNMGLINDSTPPGPWLEFLPPSQPIDNRFRVYH